MHGAFIHLGGKRVKRKVILYSTVFSTLACAALLLWVIARNRGDLEQPLSDPINWDLIQRVQSQEAHPNPLLHSQFQQDKWVIQLKPQPGVYLDIGANDARALSNTYALDRLGWKGWCVDPFPNGFETSNRTCHVVRAVVSSTSGKRVQFARPKNHALGGILDTLAMHRQEVMGARDTELVSMATLGIEDLLQQQHLPRHIDYLSVDAEGHEYEILSAFPFSAFSVDLITVEHNFEEPKSTLIRELLESIGFVLVYHVDVDFWFVSSNLTAAGLDLAAQPPNGEVQQASEVRKQPRTIMHAFYWCLTVPLLVITLVLFLFRKKRVPGALLQ